MTADNFSSKYSYVINVSFQNSSQYPIVFLYVHVGHRNNGNAFFYHIKADQKAIYIPEKGLADFQFVIPSETLDLLDKNGVSILLDFYNVFDYHTETYLHITDLNTGEYKFRVSKFNDVKRVL